MGRKTTTHWSPDREKPVIHFGPVDECPYCRDAPTT